MKKTVKKNIQKKITLLTLASVMGLTLLGCGGTDSADATLSRPRTGISENCP